MEKIIIRGGRPAGAAAAWQIARRGGRATVREMKPGRFSPAHSIDGLAELVCSNSLKSESLENAAGVLKEELRLLDSLIMKAADACRAPAGKTLAVDRARFSQSVPEALIEAGVEITRGEVTGPPEGG